MKLKDLINLEIILDKEKHNKETLRSFGLQNKEYTDIQKLKKYIDSFHLKDGLEVENLLNKGSKIASYIALLLGLLTGVTLLKFGIGGFVNIIYYMFFAVLIPVFFGLVTILYMFITPKDTILPSMALQKVVNFFLKKESVDIDKRVLYFYNLKTTALLSMFFSLGLILALILVGIAVDLPFGWSTTLNISYEYFYKFINFLATPFSFFINVPDLNMIESSQYHNIIAGHSMVESKSSSNSVHNIWWIYLIAVTIFYSLLLRVVIYLIVKFRLDSVIKEKVLQKGKFLIKGFNTPIISTHKESKPVIVKQDNLTVNKVDNIDKIYAILGWGMLSEQIALKADSLGFNSDRIYSVGGLNSIEDDLQIIDNLIDKKVVVFVNSYEAPTLDFIDFLEDLTQKVKEVVIVLLGANLKDVREDDKKIWNDKLAEFNFSNLYIKDLNDT